MRLLKLTPESERLRRIAKAHAAGEISRGEFRSIRAEVIDGFVAASQRDVGDDTQPRWIASESTTQRFPRAAAPAVVATSDRSVSSIVGVALLLILAAAVLAGAM